VERADLLLTTAQMGMALAGFAGLVTLLSRPVPRIDSYLNEIRFRNMVELSLMLAAFGLLPFVPAEFGLAQSISWRISSALYAIAGVAFLIHSVRRNRRLMGRVVIVGKVTVALFVVCAGQALMMSLNGLGVFRGLESGIYFGGLFVHFLAASFFFIRLLYGAFPGGPPAA
jgi:hypothetical protein